MTEDRDERDAHPWVADHPPGSPTVDGTHRWWAGVDNENELAAGGARRSPPVARPEVGTAGRSARPAFPEGVRRALERLTAQGIVGAETVGASTVYRLNRSHLAAPHIEAIARLRGELLARLRARFDGWEIRPAYAALFGSAASGDMHAGSDIDLFVVRPDGVDPDDADWLDQVHSLVRDVAMWTGNDVRPVELAEDEALTAARATRGLVADVSKDGIHLAGPSGFLRKKR